MEAVRIGLVGCTKSKLDHAASAKDLYMPSSLFVVRRRYVESSCDLWFILSAKHHVVDPDDVLDPYDITLVGAPVSVKRQWTSVVLQELEERLGNLEGHHFEIHAGADYWDWGLREALEQGGADVSIPTEGLGQGEQLAFYANRQRPQSEVLPTRRRSMGGSYEPLRAHLQSRDEPVVSLSFDALERILGRKLPASAHNHRAWWGNHAGTHSHARAWLEAGWKVDDVNLTAQKVVFRKDG